MEKLHSPETDELFRAILSLETVEECYRFFEDVSTIKELQDLSQRFAVGASTVMYSGRPVPVPQRSVGSTRRSITAATATSWRLPASTAQKTNKKKAVYDHTRLFAYHRGDFTGAFWRCRRRVCPHSPL